MGPLSAVLTGHGLDTLTLLSDTDGEVIRAYHADHWRLPVAKRVFIIIAQDRNIVFRRDTGLSFLQVVSKPQIAFEGKAQPDEKAEHIQSYVSILKKV